jgi:hypothetical protein
MVPTQSEQFAPLMQMPERPFHSERSVNSLVVVEADSIAGAKCRVLNARKANDERN